MRVIDDSLRQVGLELGERRVQRLAEREDVAALLHHDADLERRLALRADEIGRRILVAVRDVGDVAEPERLAVGEDRRLLDRRDALHGAADAQRHALRVGLEFAGGTRPRSAWRASRASPARTRRASRAWRG